MVAAMFTLPVAGTALNMADQHLHPRNLATAMILLAVWRILDGKRWQAAPLLLVAFLMHPLMAAMGISFCFFLILAFVGLAAVADAIVTELNGCGCAAGMGLRAGQSGMAQGSGHANLLSTCTNGPGTSGWERWRHWFSSACCGALRGSVEKLCWRDLRQRYFSMRCSSRRWRWPCCGRRRWCG